MSGYKNTAFIMKKYSSSWILFLLAWILLIAACRTSKPANEMHDAGVPDASSDGDSSLMGDAGSEKDSGSEHDGCSGTDYHARDPNITWVSIPAGGFVFGSPSDQNPICRATIMETQVPVTLTNPFQISQTEITRGQWTALGFPDPSRGSNCPTCPVGFVNYFEAAAWCNRLSELEGLEPCYDLTTCDCDDEIGAGCPSELDHCVNDDESQGAYATGTYFCNGKNIRRFARIYDCPGYRLPTTAEWEYAARARTTTNTFNGNVIVPDDYDGLCRDEPVLNPIAWYCNNSTSAMHSVHQKQPNGFGLYDILGNAFEWVDYYDLGVSLDLAEGERGEALVDPVGPSEGANMQQRGGFWGDVGCMVTASSQRTHSPGNRFPADGFRPVRTIFEKSAKAKP